MMNPKRLAQVKESKKRLIAKAYEGLQFAGKKELMEKVIKWMEANEDWTGFWEIHSQYIDLISVNDVKVALSDAYKIMKEEK